MVGLLHRACCEGEVPPSPIRRATEALLLLPSFLQAATSPTLCCDEHLTTSFCEANFD